MCALPQLALSNKFSSRTIIDAQLAATFPRGQQVPRLPAAMLAVYQRTWQPSFSKLIVLCNFPKPPQLSRDNCLRRHKGKHPTQRNTASKQLGTKHTVACNAHAAVHNRLAYHEAAQKVARRKQYAPTTSRHGGFKVYVFNASARSQSACNDIHPDSTDAATPLTYSLLTNRDVSDFPIEQLYPHASAIEPTGWCR